MATIKAKLKSKITGDQVYVQTLGELVTNAQGNTLENVEAGAQVNVIEEVKVNGVALTPDDSKSVNVDIPAVAEYTIAEAAETQTGAFKTYQLYKDNVAVAGSVINIPKDYLLKSATIETCEEANVPLQGLQVGDPYFDFVFNVKSGTAADEHMYLNASSLVDVYTPGNGIKIVSNQISVDTTDPTIADTTPTENSTKFVQSGGVYTALAGKQATIDSSHKLDADLVDDSTSTNKFVTALTASKALVSDTNGKVAASSVTSTELDLLSGMTDMLVFEEITPSS